MRLLVISHTPHYQRRGEIYGWGPTVREIDQLATRFESVRHVACLWPGQPPDSAMRYQASNVVLVPVSPSGGDDLAGKLGGLRAVPEYLRVVDNELGGADLVHVRAPANIALLSVAWLMIRRRPYARWFKYAGDWRSEAVPRSYRLQRWLLGHRWHRGVVTINGAAASDQPWVRTFLNPSLDDRELAAGRESAATKRFEAPIRLVFAGTLARSKGAERAVEVVAQLRARQVDVELDLAGDGPQRAAVEARIDALGLSSRVRTHGWLAKQELGALYARAHFVVLPSETEGWPKVLSEGMAYGAVPIASAVSAIPAQLRELGCGVALPVRDVEAFASAIASYTATKWRSESTRAVDAAERFSYSAYLERVDRLIAELREAG